MACLWFTFQKPQEKTLGFVLLKGNLPRSPDTRDGMETIPYIGDLRSDHVPSQETGTNRDLNHVNRIAENPTAMAVEVIDIDLHPVDTWLLGQVSKNFAVSVFFHYDAIFKQADMSSDGQTHLECEPCICLHCISHDEGALIGITGKPKTPGGMG